MLKTKINSDAFAKRMGAYSHGYRVELSDATMIFTTGQIALDKNGEVVGKDDVAQQAKFVFESLQKILGEANASLDDVVKVTIYLTDMNDFSKISPVRNEYLKNAEAASTLVEVNKLVNKDCKIEIEAVAIKAK